MLYKNIKLMLLNMPDLSTIEKNLQSKDLMLDIRECILNQNKLLKNGDENFTDHLIFEQILLMQIQLGSDV